MGKYIRLNNGDILYDPDTESALENDNISGNVLNLLRKGDLVYIEYCPVYGDERKIDLFRVDNIMWDGKFISLNNPGIDLQIVDGEFNCKEGIYANVKPVILSILTREKLDSIEFKVEETREIDPAR